VHFFALCFFFQAEDGIRDFHVTGVQTCALPICITATISESGTFRNAGPLLTSVTSPAPIMPHSILSLSIWIILNAKYRNLKEANEMGFEPCRIISPPYIKRKFRPFDRNFTSTTTHHPPHLFYFNQALGYDSLF